MSETILPPPQKPLTPQDKIAKAAARIHLVCNELGFVENSHHDDLANNSEQFTRGMIRQVRPDIQAARNGVLLLDGLRKEIGGLETSAWQGKILHVLTQVEKANEHYEHFADESRSWFTSVRNYYASEIAPLRVSLAKAETDLQQLYFPSEPDGIRAGVDDVVAVVEDDKTASHNLPPKAAMAWQLKYVADIKTQREIAEKMTAKLRQPIGQGQVSKWLKVAEAHPMIDSISANLPRPAEAPIQLDPDLLDIGNRTDGLTQRQRSRRESDPAD